MERTAFVGREVDVFAGAFEPWRFTQLELARQDRSLRCGRDYGDYSKDSDQG